MELVEIIRKLFVYRTTPIAYQNPTSKHWMPKVNYYANKQPVYQSYDDTICLAHLAGTIKIGLYSTAEDSTCKWIVADFDDNVFAFHHCITLRDKLLEYGIKTFIERSSSGKGYHLWLFFREPVHAAAARSIMLNALRLSGVPIHGKMEKGGNQKRSMDRLFPAQDYLPRGGFGNLVCLPLYGPAVEQGNCVFIDDHKQPYPDQHRFLIDIYETGLVDINDARVQELININPPIIIKDFDTYIAEDQWSHIKAMNPEKRLKEIEGCEAIQAGFKDANQFSEPAWQDVISNLAVYGHAAYDLVHKFSEGYDMSQITGDPTKVYSKEETDRKFYHKLDHIQRGNSPTSCWTLDSHGWTCPKLRTCPYGFIAHYGLPPSETVFSSDHPVSSEDRQWLRDLEKAKFYEFFRKFVINEVPDHRVYSKKSQKWVSNGVFDERTKVFSYRPISDFDIAAHFTHKPIQIAALHPINRHTKFAVFKLTDRKQAARLLRVLKPGAFPYYVDKSPWIGEEVYHVWVFFGKMLRFSEFTVYCHQVLKQAGIPVSPSGEDIILEHEDSFVVAPFAFKSGNRRKGYIEYLLKNRRKVLR